MKIYLDDARPTPAGWVRCYWPDEVRELYDANPSEVECISFDHDLGNDERGTGCTFLKYLEELVFHDPSTPVHLPECPPEALPDLVI